MGVFERKRQEKTSVEVLFFYSDLITSFIFICKLSTPLKLFISKTPTTSILSPIRYSSAKFPKLKPIALIIVLLSFNVSFRCFPSDNARIESIF